MYDASLSCLNLTGRLGRSVTAHQAMQGDINVHCESRQGDVCLEHVQLGEQAAGGDVRLDAKRAGTTQTYIHIFSNIMYVCMIVRILCVYSATLVVFILYIRAHDSIHKYM